MMILNVIDRGAYDKIANDCNLSEICLQLELKSVC